MANHGVWRVAFVCTLGVLMSAFQPAAAFQAEAPALTDPAASRVPSTTTQDDGADDTVLRVVEPEYRLINVLTTMPLPTHRGNFDLTHRFRGNLARGSFGHNLNNLFGLDEGAQIGVEFRFAIARRVQAAVYRTTFDKTFQFHGKYDALRQGATVPLSISALLSVEGTNNFTERRAPALGAVVSRTISDRVAMYAAPIWVHNTSGQLGVDRDTLFVGLGGRVRLRPTVYVVGEVSPRMSGYAPGPSVFGLGIEKRAGQHMFQLNFTNAFATTFGQMARGGFPTTLYLGFNLARKFF